MGRKAQTQVVAEEPKVEEVQQELIQEVAEVEEVKEETPTQETEVLEKTQEQEVKAETPAEEPTELSIDDIVSGKRPSEDKTPTWAKKRFDELTAKIYEKDRRIKELESTVIPTNRPIPPVESEFADTDEYRKARISYEDELDTWRGHYHKTQEVQEKEKREMEENLASFNVKADRMRTKYPDFDTVIIEPVFTPSMSAEIMGSDFGPEIGYFLAKNPGEAFKFSKLSANKVAKEIGKLEVKFSQASKRVSSSAPAPLVPLKGDDIPIGDPSKMSDDDYLKWYNQQKLNKLKREVKV